MSKSVFEPSVYTNVSAFPRWGAQYRSPDWRHRKARELFDGDIWFMKELRLSFLTKYLAKIYTVVVTDFGRILVPRPDGRLGRTLPRVHRKVLTVGLAAVTRVGRPVNLAFDRDNNYPLANLYVTMLARLGLEVDHFASSTGTMKKLEILG